MKNSPALPPPKCRSEHQKSTQAGPAVENKSLGLEVIQSEIKQPLEQKWVCLVAENISVFRQLLRKHVLRPVALIKFSKGSK